MKFTVKCLVNSVNSSALPEGEATTKEVDVPNPKALLSSLRAKAGLSFRLNLHGFSMVYQGDRAGLVDLSDEKKVLTECGLQDGDCIVLVSKRAREENGSEAAESAPHAQRASEDVEGVDAARKMPRVEEGGPSGAVSSGSEQASGTHDEDDDEDGDPFAAAEETDEEVVEEEGEVDLDLSAAAVAAMLGPSADAAAGELYSRLLEVVPNLVELRQEFLTNPQAVMERIQREDPTLFQLITAHQEAFVSLLNNEEAISTIQAEKDGGFYGGGGGDEDEELDEEAMENLLSMLAGGGDDVEEEDDDDEDDEGVELGPDDLAALQAGALGSNGGDSAKAAKERILAFAPSEEEEQKIQQLTQLGFAYDVCKVAFYLSHRSLERAANMLFESPPQL